MSTWNPKVRGLFRVRRKAVRPSELHAFVFARLAVLSLHVLHIDLGVMQFSSLFIECQRNEKFKWSSLSLACFIDVFLALVGSPASNPSNILLDKWKNVLSMWKLTWPFIANFSAHSRHSGRMIAWFLKNGILYFVVKQDAKCKFHCSVAEGSHPFSVEKPYQWFFRPSCGC